MGGMMSITVGDDNLQRIFLKLQTGDIDGFSAYLNRSKTDGDLCRGPGTIDRERIEGKARYEWDDTWFAQASLVSNDFFDYDSPSSAAAIFENNNYCGYAASIPESCVDTDEGVYDFNQDGSMDESDFTPVFTGDPGYGPRYRQ